MWRIVSRLTGASVHPKNLSRFYNILDLKADYRGYKSVEETRKNVSKNLASGQILHKVACLGCIHASQPSFSFS